VRVSIRHYLIFLTSNEYDRAVASGAAGVGDAMETNEVEDKTYCFCGRVSYGEMIACDDGNCEREWVRVNYYFKSFWLMKWSQFHLACMGLTSIPHGPWYCIACSEKRNALEPSRGGRRNNANARSAKAS